MLGRHGLDLVSTSTRQVTLKFPDTAAGADFLIRTAGHVVGERERLTREGRWNDLHHDLKEFVAKRAEHAADHLVLSLDYLLASMTKVGA